MLVFFLYNGFNLAILPASGNCESSTERLINEVIGSAIISDTSFKNLPAKLSMPTALFGFISSSYFEMTGTVVCINLTFLSLIWKFL